MVVGRGDLDDLVVLHVQGQGAADPAVRADGVGLGLARLVPRAGGPQVVLGLEASARRWGTPRCSCRSRRTPTRAGGRRTRSICGRRSRGRPRRWRRCSATARRTRRRTCSRGCTSRSRGRRGRCRPSPAAAPWPRPRRGRWADQAVAPLRAVRGARTGRGRRRSPRSSAATSGAVDRSTDEPSSSSTIRRPWWARSVSVCTTMPASTLREHDGTSTRVPSTSTTHDPAGVHRGERVAVAQRRDVDARRPGRRRGSSCPRAPGRLAVDGQLDQAPGRRRPAARSCRTPPADDGRLDGARRRLAEPADRRVAHHLAEIAQQREVVGRGRAARPSPAACSASSWRTVPTRQGTHCPHDSSRKKAAMRQQERHRGRPCRRAPSPRLSRAWRRRPACPRR